MQLDSVRCLKQLEMAAVATTGLRLAAGEAEKAADRNSSSGVLSYFCSTFLFISLFCLHLCFAQDEEKDGKTERVAPLLSADPCHVATFLVGSN